MTQGLSYLHLNGLSHGNFTLNNVLYNQRFVIKGYNPSAILYFPETQNDEIFMGSTSQLKKLTLVLTQDEKLEMMKLKDIYMFGLSILEFMMGEVHKERQDIALMSIPERWHEKEETTTIIHVLTLCLN